MLTSSRAGSLPQFLRCTGCCVRRRPHVGASLLAIAVGQPRRMLDVQASSRASSLPQDFALYWMLCTPQTPCGSEPARDSGGSVQEDVGCAGVIASKLAPTGFCVVLDAVRRRPRVGASLLAMAVCQSRRMLDVPPSSRAGSLPQFLRCTGCCVRRKPHVGASLLAIAVGQSRKMLDVPPSSRAGSLPQDFALYWMLCTPPTPCGSEPARDGGVSVQEDVGCADVIASGLAPTGSGGVCTVSWDHHPQNCNHQPYPTRPQANARQVMAGNRRTGGTCSRRFQPSHRLQVIAASNSAARAGCTQSSDNPS